MRSKRTFDFVHTSRRFLTVSAVILLIGLIMLGIKGLNYGIDFSAGTSVDISTSKSLNQDQVRTFLDDQKFGEYSHTSGVNRETVRFKHALSSDEEKAFKADFLAKIDPAASFEVNIVDVDIAKEQQTNAMLGMAIACIGIVLYLSIRFEWRFALAAVASIVYDALFVVCMFSIFRLEVNLPFILAVLTIIGYSINDTVVIFDRIRENLRFAKIKTHADLDRLVNDSIWQTLARSINTVITVLLAAVCLFVFGGESIKLFSLAMIFGLASGAYSSIFIASQLWLYFKKKQPIKKTAVKPQTP
ncbi:protein translocase subunit SecF [Cohnella endophytica]|uniref:Protein-export membrane protein SecF n=1 Tax=Cohnella endophytica TaxID=2419778 RepID=A0A494Y1Q3_9BACL|nr:protein translocase subunit SecF [Cohnella endophytica]RKP54272.1 protein translocase subunit SecF [Cohnella endophytica]